MFRHIFRKISTKKPKQEYKPEVKREPVAGLKPAVGHRTTVAMVPLFSWRTLLVVIIGFVMGILLAFGYWLISPSLGSGTEDASTGTSGTGTESLGLFGMLGMKVSGPFQSRVNIQVVNPGSSYMDLRELQGKAEYYAAKAKSLPFFEFLSQELEETSPETEYSVDELERIITTEYDWNLQLPAIRITAVGETESEAAFLSSIIPEAFQKYLIVEENAERQKRYENTVKEIDTVKDALLSAEQELETLQPNDILNNPEYIALNAKIEALETEVENQAIARANLIVSGTDIEGESEQILAQIKTVTQKLADAEKELNALEEAEINSSVANQTTYIELTARITALQGQLSTFMTGWTEVTSSANVIRHRGLAEMIASGDTSSPEYIQRLEDVKRTSNALAEAQKELAILESRSSESSAMTIERRFVQIKIDTLNAELTALRERQNELTHQSVEEDASAELIFTRTAAALADLRKELVNLETRLGYDRLSANLEYRVAQDEVDQLNTRLEDLIEQLGLLVGEATDSSEITGYLVSGKPLKPSPIIPERPRASQTLMMGAILGAVIAWVILNIRWITKGMPSRTSDGSEEVKKPEEPEK